MTNDNKPGGRPRDETSAPAIKAAARRLVTEKGYENVSISEIVRAACVARQTLYRRWSSKADLVLEAFFETAGEPPALSDGTGLTARLVLEKFLADIFDSLAREGDAISSLIACAQSDPEFCETFKEKFVFPREQMVRQILNKACAERELPPSTDIDTVTAMIHGAFWYRLLTNQPLDRPFAAALVSSVFPTRPT